MSDPEEVTALAQAMQEIWSTPHPVHHPWILISTFLAILREAGEDSKGGSPAQARSQ